MGSAKSGPKFILFNEDPSRCSAWLKDKGRCCHRKIAAVDQKRRDSLLQFISRAQIYGTEVAEEVANLYFCNGWHRPGGKHPIPCSEKDKIQRILFTNTPEPTNGDAIAPRQREPRAPSFPETSLSERYGSNFSTGPSARQHGRQTPQTPAANRQQEQRAPSVANESQESASISLSESERFVFANAESGAELFEHVSFTTRPNARIREQESEAPLEVSNEILHSARPRGQQLEIPAQTLAPRRQSARIRAQAPVSENSGLHEQQLEPGAQAPAAGHQSSRTQSQVPIEDRNRIHETSSVQQLRRSARIQGQEPDESLETSRSAVQATASPLIMPPTQTRRSARIRGRELDTLPPTSHPSNDRGIQASSRVVPGILRRSARLRGQQPEADRSIASSSQATLTASSPRSAPLRRSARIRGQEEHPDGADAPAAQIPAAARAPAPQSNPTNRPNESDHSQPTHSSVSAPIASEHRMVRDVDATEDCGICREPLGDGSNVCRCYNCANDFHKLCWATWLTTASKTCGSW